MEGKNTNEIVKDGVRVGKCAGAMEANQGKLWERLCHADARVGRDLGEGNHDGDDEVREEDWNWCDRM